jgi:L-galactose dehydrogenase
MPAEVIEYRPLGNTGLVVSQLSMGGSALGNVYGEVEAGAALEAVRHGIDLGMNFLDTSPYYGDTLSELRIGEALQGGYRERVVLATKAGRYAENVNNGFDYSYKRILRSWEESSRRLRTDHIDLFQLHDVEFVRQEKVVEEAWPAMVHLKEEGKVGHIGLTGYPLRHLARLASILEPPPETILSYCHYDLLNATFDEWLLPTVLQLGIGVINASVTHMGILTERGAEDWHPAPPEVHEVGRRIREHVRSRGANVTEVALLFALAHPYMATTCVGMGSVHEVDENVATLGRQLDHELLAEIEELAAPVRGTTWVQGYPEYNDPGSVASQRARGRAPHQTTT